MGMHDRLVSRDEGYDACGHGWATMAFSTIIMEDLAFSLLCMAFFCIPIES